MHSFRQLILLLCGFLGAHLLRPTLLEAAPNLHNVDFRNCEGGQFPGARRMDARFSASRQLPRTAKLILRIDSLLATQQIRPFNGIVEIHAGQHLMYRRSQGFGDMLRKSPFPHHAQFIIGSVSKQVTAVLVLQACEAGLLQRHVPIRAYLPELPMAWADTVTIHQLLCHISGFEGRDRPLAFRAGSRFSYSNQGYGLLGEILARVRGRGYDALVGALFAHCQMRHSAAPLAYKGHSLVTGFARLPDGSIAADTHAHHFAPTPAAQLISTPSDLARWNRCLHHGKLLQDSSYRAMIAPSSKRPHPIFGDVDYGYGVQTTQGNGVFEISHGGYVPGFVTVNFYYPATDISLIAMENLDWRDPSFKESYFFAMQIRRMLRESGLLAG